MTNILNRSIFNAALYSKIHDIWFHGLPKENPNLPPEQLIQTRWFPRGPAREEFDNVCKQNFEEALTAIGPESDKSKIANAFLNEIDTEKDDAKSAETALAVVILLDQIPRNMFRSKEALPRIYSHYDTISQSLVHALFARRRRADLHPLIRYTCAKRQWLYMPLMHSESLADHEKFGGLLAEWQADLEQKGDQEGLMYVSNMQKFEVTHGEIVERFGRYPYRNEALGRESTAEEVEWLKDGETFGTG